ncbi:MAG: GrpB family protein [Streptosporangiaceae bacterium]
MTWQWPTRARAGLRAGTGDDGFRLTIREPWWYGHRMLRADEPPCNLHVFGTGRPELVRHRIFRDWLRGNPGDRDPYAATERHAAAEANAGAEHVMQ